METLLIFANYTNNVITILILERDNYNRDHYYY